MTSDSSKRSTLVHTSAKIRLTGSKQEIKLVLKAFANGGIEYTTTNIYSACDENPERFNLYLTRINVPPVFKSHSKSKAKVQQSHPQKEDDDNINF